MFALALVLAASLSNGASDVFLQRLTDNGFPPQQKPIITAGALPPNWTPPVPLPQNVPIIGSVIKPKFSPEIYYQPKVASAKPTSTPFWRYVSSGCFVSGSRKG